MEGAKMALICHPPPRPLPRTAQGPESRGYELLISGCIPAYPWWCLNSHGVDGLLHSVREPPNRDASVIKFALMNIREDIISKKKKKKVLTCLILSFTHLLIAK